MQPETLNPTEWATAINSLGEKALYGGFFLILFYILMRYWPWRKSKE
jgi:hypothetical protein